MEEVLYNSVGIFKEGPDSYVLTFAEIENKDDSIAKKFKSVNESDEERSVNHRDAFNNTRRIHLLNSNNIEVGQGLKTIAERMQVTANVAQEKSNKSIATSEMCNKYNTKNNIAEQKLNVPRTDIQNGFETVTLNNSFSIYEIKLPLKKKPLQNNFMNSDVHSANKINGNLHSNGLTLDSKEGDNLRRGEKIDLKKAENNQSVNKEVHRSNKITEERPLTDNQGVYSEAKRKRILRDLTKKQWERNEQNKIGQPQYKLGNMHSLLKNMKDFSRKRRSDDEGVSMVTTEGTLVEMTNMAGTVEELICNLLQNTQGLRKDLGVCRKVVPTNFYNPPIDNVTSTIIKGIIHCVQDRLVDGLACHGCITLHRELHAFLHWLIKGTPGMPCCPSRKDAAAERSSFLFGAQIGFPGVGCQPPKLGLGGGRCAGLQPKYTEPRRKFPTNGRAEENK